MIHKEYNTSLREYNTFKINIKASQLVWFDNQQDIDEIINLTKKHPFMILGGGSNILFTSDISQIIIKPDIKSIDIVYEDDNNILLKVGAGMSWDDLVQYCVDRNYGGLENLSLIPGNVGASPIQNIGAYGVEVKDVIESVEFINLGDDNIQILRSEDCHFGYRNSIFKGKLKGNFINLFVSFNLTKRNHNFKLEYGNLKEEMKLYDEINICNIRKAIVDIRNRKLPDPKLTGNAGSFFKNPIVPKELLNNIQNSYPQIPFFEISENEVKIPAAWLIEKCGWKGKKLGNAGVHENQPLVLVNHTGEADGKDILFLAKQIIEDVGDTFEIKLELEVNVV